MEFLILVSFCLVRTLNSQRNFNLSIIFFEKSTNMNLKASLLALVLLLGLLQGGQAGSESQCCSDCNEIKRNSMIGGFEAFYLRTSIRAYMMRNMPFSLIANLISNMPQNVTSYLSARSKDLEER